MHLQICEKTYGFARLIRAVDQFGGVVNVNSDFAGGVNAMGQSVLTKG